MVTFENAFEGRSIWLSGHTGFKGAWLAEWLIRLGARVHGYGLNAHTQPSLFEQLALARRMDHQLGDIRDFATVRDSIREAQPDFVFHLAAQSLVRVSYQKPQETYDVNLMGTVNVLEGLREYSRPCAAVFITTDKCYENKEWIFGYREEDPLGGRDPYSSSKAAAELAIAAYRRSFFQAHPVKVASARAGNVIGGGDWAQDRLVPDCVRALQRNQPVIVRNPHSTRPWQHVLEPLSGYLWLAALLAHPAQAPVRASELQSAFNFGPNPESNRRVGQLVELVLSYWPGSWQSPAPAASPHEACLLNLCTDKANALLGWTPVWNFQTAVEQTIDWYRQAAPNRPSAEIGEFTAGQIERFTHDAAALDRPWARRPRPDTP